MKLNTEWVELSVGGAPARAYVASPAAAKQPLPGVVVIQEAFGVDGFIQDITERLASTGYAALAPDLYSYGGTPPAVSPPRVEAAKQFLDTVPQAAWFDPALRAPALQALGPERAAQLEESLALLLTPNRPWAQYVSTLKAGRAWLSANRSRGEKVGALGFCLGGALCFRLAAGDPELAAAVVFYGLAPPPELVPSLRAPVLGLYAGTDPRINGGVPALAEALSKQGTAFEHHTYEGTLHAFMNDTRANYHPGAARDAWARALMFLARTLGRA